MGEVDVEREKVGASPSRNRSSPPTSTLPPCSNFELPTPLLEPAVQEQLSCPRCMARLVGLRSLAARGQLVPRPPLSSAGHSGWQVVRRRSEERTEASPSSRKLAVVVVNGSTQNVPRLIRASFPSSSDGQREVVYSSEDVVRLSQGYSRLRGITDFDRLLPKFLAQKQFEKQQETRARSGTRRHLNKMGASAVSRREFEIRGKRGVPDVRVSCHYGSFRFVRRARADSRSRFPLFLRPSLPKTGTIPRRFRSPSTLVVHGHRQHSPAMDLRGSEGDDRCRSCASRWHLGPGIRSQST